MKRKDGALVTMPKRVTFKPGPAGTRYVYLTTRAYRNAKGHPTSDEVAIGKLAADGISLIPNQRYFELFAAQNTVYPSPQSLLALGDTAVLSVLADKLKLIKLLEETTKDLAPSVLTASLYMVLEGNVMYHIDTFCQERFLPYKVHLDSQRISDLFASLSFDMREAFLRRWISMRQEEEYIAYDVTSLSTYSGGIEDAEWGHNRDQEDLCQINLGMFLGEKTRLPVYYQTYQGSILDKVHLAYMMASAAALGISKMRFVFDRGFVTKDNLEYVSNKHLSFVSALPISRNDAVSLISYAAPIIRSSKNLVDNGLYAVSCPVEIDGLKVCAHIFFSSHKAAIDEEIIYARISRLQYGLEGLEKDTKRIAKRYSEYFDVTLGKGDINFKRNSAKIDAKLAQTGYFILITNDFSLDAAGALAIYRDKDIIEKAFAGLKNYLDFKRMHTHSTITTDGKLFVGFISLILRSEVRRALSLRLQTANISVDTALRELHKLKRITYADGSVVHTAVSKTQREVLCSLGIDIETLLASA